MCHRELEHHGEFVRSELSLPLMVSDAGRGAPKCAKPSENAGLLASKREPSGNYERNHRSSPWSARDRELASDPGSAFTHPEESKMSWSSVL